MMLELVIYGGGVFALGAILVEQWKIRRSRRQRKKDYAAFVRVSGVLRRMKASYEVEHFVMRELGLEYFIAHGGSCRICL